VFGGLYLPHLRDAIWRNLAEAEGVLRQGETLTWDVVDLDGDGHDEVWVHSAAFSAVVCPARGGSVEEYTVFDRGINYANALTRRREAYLDLALAEGGDGTAGGDEGVRLDARPPLDTDDRALLVDRVLPRGVTFEEFSRGDYWSVLSWARRRCRLAVARESGSVIVTCTEVEGRARLNKRLSFDPQGTITVSWTWDPAAADPDDMFTTELSLGGPVALEPKPPAEEWRFDIETVAKSERGLDRTRQGESVALRWPVQAAAARLVIRPEPAA
jgi:hypothetical protein